ADHAVGRYVSTQLEDITRAIYPPEDLPILKQNTEEGDLVEYRYFVSVLPMSLVNGACGIGSGVSTNIPCYNPLDIIQRIEWLMDDVDLATKPRLVPWYQGYTGTMELNGQSWSSTGILEPGKKGYWHIKELAIGVSTGDFKEWLEYLQYGIIPKGRKWKKLE